MAKSKGHEKSVSKTKTRHLNDVENVAKKKAKEAKSKMLFSFMSAICIVVAAWFSYKGYLETRVNTPYDAEKLVSILKTDDDHNRGRFWGSYRTGLYFGMQTRDPHSLVAGLMWYFPKLLRQGKSGIRHWCEQGDGLDRYGWLEHDGKTFGIQEIVDAEGGVLVNTSFVKKAGGAHGGDWTARISVTNANSKGKKKEEENAISLIFYSAIQEKSNGRINAAVGGDNIISGIEGSTENLGLFRLSLSPTKGRVEEHSFLVTVTPGLQVLNQVIVQNLKLASQKGSNKQHIVLAGEQLSTKDGKKLEPNFVATQVTAKAPFEFEVSFESASFVDRASKLVGKNFDEALKARSRDFHAKFEKTFGLESKGFDAEQVKFAKAALSNMIGGIGYFYGSAQVQSVKTENPVPYWKAPLYTAVPSRSFFPRGFLWDEGFHGLLLSAWDLDIELDVMGHWFDLMNAEGWIPREMILGQEALSKVPEQFVTQRNTDANPPTFFLTLNSILDRQKNELVEKNWPFLEKLYPRLQAWFEWFNSTQTGSSPGSYRWRGRDSSTDKELNPKTLTSGLDDYPRASHPDTEERHVDLRCWMAFAAKVMSKMTHVLEKQKNKYRATYEYLSDNKLLNELHWSEASGSYADYGLHTDKVALRKTAPKSPKSPSIARSMVREVLEAPVYRHVASAFGYVSLFPLMLQIISPDSPKLDKILDDIRDPNLIWTKFGLRSLSKTSPIYGEFNTEHDPPYWRGAVWINLNFLVVRALHHYANVEGAYRAKAGKIYHELRENLIRNLFEQYKKSGFLWENYQDSHGAGKGSHPFTGWSSLVVLLMAEIY